MGNNSWPKRHHAHLWSATKRDAAGDLHYLRDRREISMTVVDFVEAWWLSIRGLLESAGVDCHFERSPGDRLNPSCSLNLRRSQLEADVLVWESGEAELVMVELDGSVDQQLFEDIRNVRDLGAILSKCAALGSSSST